MPALGLVICALAAYRLRAMPLPLAGAAFAVVAANLAVVSWRLALLGRGRTASRPITALQHITAALGGFFLFVSFALP